MAKIDDFIINTDFGTLKNDGNATATITIPAGVVVPEWQKWLTSVNVKAGGKGSSVQASFFDPSYPDREFLGSSMQLMQHGSIRYDVFIYLTRTTTEYVTINALIWNSYGGGSITTASPAKTITVKLTTFKSPFE